MGNTDGRTILVVDDDQQSRRLMATMLAHYGYRSDTASSGLEALRKTRQSCPDLILLDLLMPEMDGFETLKRLREDPRSQHVPIVIVTGLIDMESKVRGLAAGANDFLTKPFDAAELMVRTENLLRIKEFEDFLQEYNVLLETEIETRTAQLKGALWELRISRDTLRHSYLDTIARLTTVSECMDESTAFHVKRIGHYCQLMARTLGWSEKDAELIFYASPMHDIGKVGIPTRILLKPGRLTAGEFEIMSTHTTIGAKIMQGSTSAYLQLAEQIALTHHEKWDGSGYPSHLREDDIPIEGSLMSIADVYDALRSARPYKPPFDHDTAFRIITEGDGRTLPSHFAPEVLQVFMDTHHQLSRIFQANQMYSLS